jgi:chemotaxis protein MotB
MRPRAEEEKKPPDTTMVLFTSLVLILLTFFIMMTAKANFDETKYGKVLTSVSRTFGLFEGGLSAIGSPDGIPSPDASLSDGPARFREQDRDMANIRSLLAPSLMDGRSRIVRNQGQRIITLNQALLFQGDQTELSPEAAPFLLALARILRDSQIALSVEGHTDDLPPRSSGAGDNWDISLARAISVVEFLSGEGQMPLSRLAAYGYGGQKPMVANNSPANRAKNNRVDLVMDFDSARAGALRGLAGQDRSYDYQGFEFSLPLRPGPEETEVY